MTDMEDLLGEQTPTPAGGRRAERSRRRGPGCLIALVVLAVLAGAAYWGVTTGIDKIQDQFSSADDYPGPGSGEVNFEVKQGDSIAEMGRGLKEAGVVASVDAFISAAGANPEAGTIQAGFYPLLKEMKASDVVAILVDPDKIVTTDVTIPEGLRVKDVVALLVESTGFPKADFDKALQDPAALGLPAYAEGNPEGYLFPATYDFGPEEKPADMLTRHGGALAAGSHRQRPGGQRRGARLHAAGDHDDRQPDRGRGPRQVPRQDRPGHLQPVGDRPQPRGRLPADRRERQLRARSHRLHGHHRRGQGVGGRLAVQHLHAEGLAADARSRRPATTRSRPRCTPRRARGSST